MPRYFFHLRDGSRRFDDPEGVELADFPAARIEAVEAARQILGEALKAGKTLNRQAFEIADEAGEVLDTVSFKLTVRSS